MQEAPGVDMSDRVVGEALVFSPRGRLDTYSARPFEDRVNAALEAGVRMLILDLAGVEFISSAGLWATLKAVKKGHEMGAHVALCALRPEVEKVFLITGFLPRLPVFATLDQALAACAAFG